MTFFITSIILSIFIIWIYEKKFEDNSKYKIKPDNFIESIKVGLKFRKNENPFSTEYEIRNIKGNYISYVSYSLGCPIIDSCEISELKRYEKYFISN